MTLLVRGGRLIDPIQGIDALRDLCLRDGVVIDVGEHLDPAGAESFDATGCIVAPGFIDMHVHLREPGATHKETVASGAAAAVAGGFTAVACMPNTEPAIDSPAMVAEVKRLAASAGLARVYPVGALTRGRAGKELAPYWRLRDAGAVAFSDDGATVASARVLRQAASYALDVPAPFISHCEDDDLKGHGVMNEGPQSMRLGVAGSPAVAEAIVVARDLLLAADTGKHFHIAHLSTAEGLDLLRYARAKGAPVSCEVTPHHLLLSDDAVRGFRADAKVNPPLRTEKDTAALRAAVREGAIDVLATDHAPHAAEEKAQLLAEAPVGFSGLEIAVGAYARALPDLPPAQLVSLLSVNPARILSIPGGTLAPGSPADLTILRAERWTVDPARFHSLGKNTPFAGWTFELRAHATIVGGSIVMRDGVVFART